MATESYEVVFADVPAKKLLALLTAIEGSAETLSDLKLSEPILVSRDGGVYKELIDDFLTCENAICLSELLGRFRVAYALLLPLVLLRVVKFGAVTDVELSFDWVDELDADGLMEAMQVYAGNLCKIYEVAEFYGGLEPAVDIETRYFTNDKLGPLAMKR
jgi:hypothetical protein